MELMKLFRKNLSEKELSELKSLLVKFYADKVMDEADKLWDERGVTNEDMDNWLNSNS
jgi:hypothetical protein